MQRSKITFTRRRLVDKFEQRSCNFGGTHARQNTSHACQRNAEYREWMGCSSVLQVPVNTVHMRVQWCLSVHCIVVAEGRLPRSSRVHIFAHFDGECSSSSCCAVAHLHASNATHVVTHWWCRNLNEYWRSTNSSRSRRRQAQHWTLSINTIGTN